MTVKEYTKEFYRIKIRVGTMRVMMERSSDI
jgi:hypothetical protein